MTEQVEQQSALDSCLVKSLWHSEIIHYKSPLLVGLCSELNASPPYCFKIHVNIIFPSTSKPSKKSLSFWCWTEMLQEFLSSAMSATCTAHPVLFFFYLFPQHAFRGCSYKTMHSILSFLVCALVWVSVRCWVFHASDVPRQSGPWLW